MARNLLFSAAHSGRDAARAAPPKEYLEESWQKSRMFPSHDVPGTDHAGLRADDQWAAHLNYRDRMGIALSEAGSALMYSILRGAIRGATGWELPLLALHAATLVDRDVVSLLLPAFANRVGVAQRVAGTALELRDLLSLELLPPGGQCCVLYSPRGAAVEAPCLSARVVATFRHGGVASTSRVLCIELDNPPRDSSPVYVTTLCHVQSVVGAGGARLSARAAELRRIDTQLYNLLAQAGHTVANAPIRGGRRSGNWQPVLAAIGILLEAAEPLLEAAREKACSPVFIEGQSVWYTAADASDEPAKICSIHLDGDGLSYFSIHVETASGRGGRDVQTVAARLRPRGASAGSNVVGAAALLARCVDHVRRMHQLQSTAAAVVATQRRAPMLPVSRHMEAETVSGMSMLPESIELKQRLRRCWTPHLCARNFRESLHDMTLEHCVVCGERWWDKRVAAVKAASRAKEREFLSKPVKAQRDILKRRGRAAASRGMSSAGGAAAPSVYLCKRCGDHRQKQASDFVNDEAYDIFGATNNQLPSAVPDALKSLTNIEQMLISKACPIMTVFLLKFGQHAGRGHCVALPQDLQPLATALPRRLRDVDVFVVVSQQGAGSGAIHREFTVNRVRVARALRWLTENNPYYVRFHLFYFS